MSPWAPAEPAPRDFSMNTYFAAATPLVAGRPLRPPPEGGGRLLASRNRLNGPRHHQPLHLSENPDGAASSPGGGPAASGRQR